MTGRTFDEAATERPQRSRTRPLIIDCDVHNELASDEALRKYLPARWRRHQELFGDRAHWGADYPRMHPQAARADAWPPSGAPPGSDLQFVREQLLDLWNVEYAVLNHIRDVGGQLNLSYAAAIARATNDWQCAEWLDLEPRVRASIVVSYEDADAAASEIERRATDPRFVQVLLLVRTSEPLGRRKYWKMNEAAASHGLPIGIHFGGAGGGPTTGAGLPSFYIEEHAGMATAFQDQVVSLVCEGVFDTFPSLRFVLIEGGVAWLLPLMWRLDRAWEKLHVEVPHVKRRPSEYIRDHFWLTTQPMEEPPTPEYFREHLVKLDMYDRLMFATDYPHWDFDAPDQAFPVKLPSDVAKKIMSENARALYGFQTTSE